MERVAAVKPFWQSRTQTERVQLLTISLEELRQKAKDLAEASRKPAGKSVTGRALFEQVDQCRW